MTIVVLCCHYNMTVLVVLCVHYNITVVVVLCGNYNITVVVLCGHYNMTVLVVVPQQQLNTFLAAAEDLEILGLSKKCANIHIGGDDDDFDALPELTAKRKGRRRSNFSDKYVSEGSSPDTI